MPVCVGVFLCDLPATAIGMLSQFSKLHPGMLFVELADGAYGATRVIKATALKFLLKPFPGRASSARDHKASHGQRRMPTLSRQHRFCMKPMNSFSILKMEANVSQLRVGNAGQSAEPLVGNAFRSALNAHCNRDTILAVMRLKGFGSTPDDETGQRRATFAAAASDAIVLDSGLWAAT